MEKTKSVKTTCELTFLGKSAKIKEGSPITLETLCGSSIIVASHELDVYSKPDGATESYMIHLWSVQFSSIYIAPVELEIVCRRFTDPRA